MGLLLAHGWDVAHSLAEVTANRSELAASTAVKGLPGGDGLDQSHGVY